ncbi:Gfo/Idh/MocA family protein [Leucothrix pacifica]|uniref:Oxidoreductase n=1 Tax=Leucothrix pacifica TaxID=1247513 RepID=A0A317CQP2_9GAMM|nr:Gfo/Idh/MocA family oxidoreductase [Leucothrix pacifica]PWR00715.1 oxidoreductase [Leucothrix pacifica]
MLRVGILSTAKIGREQLIPAGLAAEGVCIQGIASRSLAPAQALAEHFQIPQSFASYDELLASDNIDAVYIPLPTSQHIEWAIRAADAGKHVLVEKPLALKADDIQTVIDARDRNGVIITEAFMVHYHPQWAFVREQLATGRIGRLRNVQGVFSYYNRDPDNMRNQAELGGGGLPDIGVYPTVTTRIATGKEPHSVSANVEFDPVFNTDIYANVHAAFEGFDLNFYVSTTMAAKQAMRFHGDEGYIELSAPFNAGLYDISRVSVFNQSHTLEQEITFPNVNQYRLQWEALAQAVSTGDASKLFSLENSVRNQRLIDAAYRSSELGERVEV